jgi:hypothetical protein
MNMTDVAAQFGRFAEGDFRIGTVLNRTWLVLSRNFFAFCAVTAVASLPNLLLMDPGQSRGMVIAGAVLADVMRRLSQAMLIYGAFQELRGQPVSLGQSLQAGLRRIIPVIGLAISASVLMALGFILFTVPGVIVATMLFVATPVCVVERLGPFASMDRSAQLTKGHRWKILGLLVLAIVPLVIGDAIVEALAEIAGAGGVAAAIGQVLVDAIWGAVDVVLVIAAYHDLRVAKEGVDTAQIAAVFE